MIGSRIPVPRLALLYRKSDCKIERILSGNLTAACKPEDFGLSSKTHALHTQFPPDYMRNSDNYVLKRVGDRVALMLRPYYLHVTAVAGGTIANIGDISVRNIYQARIPVGTEFVFHVEKRDSSRHVIADGDERVKVAVPLGVNVITPSPPVLTLEAGIGEVRLGPFEFPATLETHIYPLDNIDDIVDNRVFMHFHLDDAPEPLVIVNGD